MISAVEPEEFLRILRENPALFPRQWLQDRSGLSRSQLLRILHAKQLRNPVRRGEVDPKLSSILRLVEAVSDHTTGARARLLISLPASTVADLSRRVVRRG